MSSHSPASDAAAISADGIWLADRYDPANDAWHFRHTPREEHRAATFLTDEYLPPADRVPVPRKTALDAAASPAPLHFVFHSAYCCSTLLARAFDLPGKAMGLKEPVVLNDMVGWRRRGGDPRQVADVLSDSLRMLARPLEAGEAVIVKPSNVVNPMIGPMLSARPDAQALFLHAPLRGFLASIAKKGMWGRLWVRELMAGYAQDGAIGFGLDTTALLKLTDLQAAALGWLTQHAIFAQLAEQAPDRIRTLDSDSLLARPVESVAALYRHFGIAIDADEAERIATGPAFTRHSKDGSQFAAADRVREEASAVDLHADEIEKVALWAEATASHFGLSLDLPSPLLP